MQLLCSNTCSFESDHSSDIRHFFLQIQKARSTNVKFLALVRQIKSNSIIAVGPEARNLAFKAIFLRS